MPDMKCFYLPVHIAQFAFSTKLQYACSLQVFISAQAHLTPPAPAGLDQDALFTVSLLKFFPFVQINHHDLVALVFSRSFPFRSHCYQNCEPRNNSSLPQYSERWFETANADVLLICLPISLRFVSLLLCSFYFFVCVRLKCTTLTASAKIQIKTLKLKHSSVDWNMFWRLV